MFSFVAICELVRYHLPIQVHRKRLCTQKNRGAITHRPNYTQIRSTCVFLAKKIVAEVCLCIFFVAYIRRFSHADMGIMAEAIFQPLRNRISRIGLWGNRRYVDRRTIYILLLNSSLSDRVIFFHSSLGRSLVQDIVRMIYTSITNVLSLQDSCHQFALYSLIFSLVFVNVMGDQYFFFS